MHTYEWRRCKCTISEKASDGEVQSEIYQCLYPDKTGKRTYVDQDLFDPFDFDYAWTTILRRGRYNSLFEALCLTLDLDEKKAVPGVTMLPREEPDL